MPMTQINAMFWQLYRTRHIHSSKKKTTPTTVHRVVRALRFSVDVLLHVVKLKLPRWNIGPGLLIILLIQAIGDTRKVSFHVDVDVGEELPQLLFPDHMKMS